MKMISHPDCYRMDVFSTTAGNKFNKMNGKILRRSQSISYLTRFRDNRNYTNLSISLSPSTIMKMKDQNEDSFDDIRIALAGAKSCGKSALAVRYLTKRFIGEYDSHKDVTLTRSVRVADREVQLYLKDTTGTGWLKSPASLINWTSAIIVVYSITDRASFNLARNVLETIHKIKPLHSRCTLLIGNKSDLIHLRQVDKRDAKRLASDFGVQFLECSASENYEDVCNLFTRLIVEAMIVQNARSTNNSHQDFVPDDSNGQDVTRSRRRSSSHGQAMFRDRNNNSSKTFNIKKDDKKEVSRQGSLETSERIPSPTGEIVPQRKQSLRRKISGILVGSQSNR